MDLISAISKSPAYRFFGQILATYISASSFDSAPGYSPAKFSDFLFGPSILAP
jgi:hypothetical protein